MHDGQPQLLIPQAPARSSSFSERTNQFFFWSSATDDQQNAVGHGSSRSLLSRAPTPSASTSGDLEAFGKVTSSASETSGATSGNNPFSASAAAYGTFFGPSKVAYDDDDVESGSDEEPAVPSHTHPSRQALLLSAAFCGTVTMVCLVQPPAISFEALTTTVAGNASVGFCFFFISEIAAQVPPPPTSSCGTKRLPLPVYPRPCPLMPIAPSEQTPARRKVIAE